jgi:hypothetical protein
MPICLGRSRDARDRTDQSPSLPQEGAQDELEIGQIATERFLDRALPEASVRNDANTAPAFTLGDRRWSTPAMFAMGQRVDSAILRACPVSGNSGNAGSLVKASRLT